jgi:hypothetical protein
MQVGHLSFDKGLRLGGVTAWEPSMQPAPSGTRC